MERITLQMIFMKIYLFENLLLVYFIIKLFQSKASPFYEGT